MIESFLRSVSNLVWGAPLILLLIGTSIYFSWKLKFLQVTHLKLAGKYLLRPSDDSASGDISLFGSICTALSSTLGVGNIIGVALAISAGEPGALFWMWELRFSAWQSNMRRDFWPFAIAKLETIEKYAAGPCTTLS